MGWYASLTVVGHLRLVSLSMRTPKVISAWELRGDLRLRDVLVHARVLDACSELGVVSDEHLGFDGWIVDGVARESFDDEVGVQAGHGGIVRDRHRAVLAADGVPAGRGTDDGVGRSDLGTRPGHPRSKIGLAPRGECRGGRARVRGHSLSGYQMPRSDDIAVVVLELQPIRHVDRNARGEVRSDERTESEEDLPVVKSPRFHFEGRRPRGE